ncbi:MULTISPECIES: hypothetical protein [unclassified Streptomyces]
MGEPHRVGGMGEPHRVGGVSEPRRVRGVARRLGPVPYGRGLSAGGGRVGAGLPRRAGSHGVGEEAARRE